MIRLQYHLAGALFVSAVAAVVAGYAAFTVAGPNAAPWPSPAAACVARGDSPAPGHGPGMRVPPTASAACGDERFPAAR
jgi:hypothetical protein